MGALNISKVFQPSPSGVDSFGRSRVSNPLTIFDSKLLFDKQPLLWDEALVSGAGITSSHNPTEAAVRIDSTGVAGRFLRQTFMRFNYQPGKSQQIVMTGNLQLSGGGVGCTGRLGLFDDENGVFFENDENTIYVGLRSNFTGSVVNTRIDQNNWNLDSLDGNGPSGVSIDWTNAQIFIIDFQWLGVGKIRFGVEAGLDEPVYCHVIENANQNIGVYMSTPNLPLRFEVDNNGGGVAYSIMAICCSISSEGGTDDNGVLRYASTDGLQVDANTPLTIYALVGIRLKSAYIGATVKILRASVLAENNDDFEYLLILNPTVAGTFTYTGLTDSAVETARGATANTVTGGIVLDGGFVPGTRSETVPTENALYLGQALDGSIQELVLCARPITANLDVNGSITWREIT